MRIVCLQTVKWLQALLFNTNSSIQHYSFGHKCFEVLLGNANNSIHR